MDKFTDEDFAAFLLYAGPPPKQMEIRRSHDELQFRLTYVESCDKFCSEYFDTQHETERWIDFYGAFMKWFKERGNE